jgi:hypothetical protein
MGKKIDQQDEMNLLLGNLEESIIITTSSKPQFVNDNFIQKFQSVLQSFNAPQEEVENQPIPPSLFKRFK